VLLRIAVPQSARTRGLLFAALLGLFVILVLNYVANWLLDTWIQFAWSALDVVPALFAWMLPFAAIGYLPTARRAVRWAAFLIGVPPALWAAMYALGTLTRLGLTLSTGYINGERPLSSAVVGRDRVAVYLVPPVASIQPYAGEVRQERTLPGGLLVLERRVYYVTPADEGSIQLQSADSAQINLRLDPHEPESRDVVVPFRPL
jgi:hypothetical protein